MMDYEGQPLDRQLLIIIHQDLENHKDHRFDNNNYSSNSITVEE